MCLFLKMNVSYDIGAVFVLSPTIDRETASTHVLTISAYSSNLLASKITGTLTITVTDKNDVTPAFSQVSRLIPH